MTRNSPVARSAIENATTRPQSSHNQPLVVRPRLSVTLCGLMPSRSNSSSVSAFSRVLGRTSNRACPLRVILAQAPTVGCSTKTVFVQHPPARIRRSLVRVQVGEPESAGAALRGGSLSFLWQRSHSLKSRQTRRPDRPFRRRRRRLNARSTVESTATGRWSSFTHPLDRGTDPDVIGFRAKLVPLACLERRLDIRGPARGFRKVRGAASEVGI